MVPMTTLAPSVTHRDPKGRKFVSIVETAYDKADLTDKEAQRVNDTPGLAELVADFIAENRVIDKFKNEEVTSTYGYLSDYREPKSITEQCYILCRIFRGVRFADKKLAERAVPANAEGWFAIPKWQTIAPTYGEAVQKVLDALKSARSGRFYNYHDGRVIIKRLRQSAKTEAVFQKLCLEQPDHDILVVAAQFGLRHRGRSVRRAREVMQANECGLGVFAIGIMILTHPERLSHHNNLWIDCSGDEFDDPDADGVFSNAPVFIFHDGQVKFDDHWVADANVYYGSASAFVPQS
jgi:hypothetical protein